MKKSKIILVLIFTLCLVFVARSQANNRLWLSSGIEKNLIKKKLDFGLNLGARTNSAEFNKLLIQPDFSFRLSKSLDLLAIYRYTALRNRTENRVSLGIKWSDKIVKRTYLSFKYRHQVEKLSSKESFENTSRLKTTLKHKIKKKKLYPYLYNETFYELKPGDYAFNKTRLGLGCSIKSLKRQEIKLNYFRGIEFGKPGSGRNVFGISYTYDLK